MAGHEDVSSQISEEDFMRMFVRHEPTLRAFARSILPDWHTVDDALQEASVIMWKKRHQLQSAEGFLPWAKVIVRFKCLATAAALAARRERPVLNQQVLELLARDAEALRDDDLARLRRALADCLKKFPPARQELLLAPYAGNGRVKQLAEECGKSVNAIYKLLGRLREKLSLCIRGQLQQEVS